MDRQIAYSTHVLEGEGLPSSRRGRLAQEDLFGYPQPIPSCNKGLKSNLSPLIKWPGGKERELKHILPNLPEFVRYFEPFVGGGAVFMGVRAQEYYINDLSSELIALYHSVAATEPDFFRHAELIDTTWSKVTVFAMEHRELGTIYKEYRDRGIGWGGLKQILDAFCRQYASPLSAILGSEYSLWAEHFLEETKVSILRKMQRMCVLERERHPLPETDIEGNIETALKSALYVTYRTMYNDLALAEKAPHLHTALFFFIRNYAYSGMFRYSAHGGFNVPYGGMAYNAKSLSKKLAYYRSSELLDHLTTAQIYCLDFETFLRRCQPGEEDFIFLDPPYDSEFSTYAQQPFDRMDQQRLADYLLQDCRAKWMMIIKNTDFIYSLYDREGIYIRSFEKSYQVSFMNRNERKVTHLLITNYL